MIIEPDEDAEGNPAWHAYCPALVNIGAATSGRTREEALKNINQVVRYPKAPLARSMWLKFQRKSRA